MLNLFSTQFYNIIFSTRLTEYHVHSYLVHMSIFHPLVIFVELFGIFSSCFQSFSLAEQFQLRYKV